MAEEPEEKPTLDKPKEETKAKPEIDIEGLMSKLETFKVTKPDGSIDLAKLEGRLVNAAEYGKLAGENTRLSQELLNAQRQLSESKPYRPSRDKDFDLDNYSQGQTVDLEALIENKTKSAVKSVLTEYQKEQVELQKKVFQTQSKILKDRNYEKVKEVYQKKLQSPEIMMGIQMGQIDAYDLYRDTVDEFKDGLLLQSSEVIQTLTKGKKVPIPHVETGERVGTNIVSDSGKPVNKMKQRYDELQTKVNKGGILSAEEELELADMVVQGMRK